MVLRKCVCAHFLFAQIPAMSVQIDKYDHNESKEKTPKVQPMNIASEQETNESEVGSYVKEMMHIHMCCCMHVCVCECGLFFVALVSCIV